VSVVCESSTQTLRVPPLCLRPCLLDTGCALTWPTLSRYSYTCRYSLLLWLHHPQALGYPGEIGYQSFLYSSVKEWRKLLMFLLEKLPKEAAQASDEPTGACVMLGRTIAAELVIRLQSPWTPAFCKRGGTAWSGSSSWLEVSRQYLEFGRCYEANFCAI